MSKEKNPDVEKRIKTTEVIKRNDVEKKLEEDCHIECKRKINNKITFFKSLEAIVIDQISIFILSLICLLLFSLIVSIFGYFILSSYYIVFLFIAYVSISILYPVIMEACIGNTIGRKICNLKILETE